MAQVGWALLAQYYEKQVLKFLTLLFNSEIFAH